MSGIELKKGCIVTMASAGYSRKTMRPWKNVSKQGV